MVTFSVSAPLHPFQAHLQWVTFDWERAERWVYRLQRRIAKATVEKRFNKVKVLQRLLTRSFYARMLAVRQVTSNKGKHTPGVDKEVWSEAHQKGLAANKLSKVGYKPQPLRRIYIPKKNGKLRPLSIPTMRDRAMQALFLLALNPVAETTADRDSFGFRQHRSAHDALQKCYCNLASKGKAQWILEADIKSCFDEISHEWILNNIPIDKQILKRWLKSGYVEDGTLFDTSAGTPQGGIISPVICNMVLDGLQQTVNNHKGVKKCVNFIRYADDFIVTGNSPETLKEIQQDIEKFLAERGLALSKEKTKITHINDGFDFLGFNIRKYNGKYLSKPSKDNVKKFCSEIKSTIKKYNGGNAEQIIKTLNPKLTGWANYYRSSCAKSTFSYIDNVLFGALLRWVKRRFNKTSLRQAVGKHFRNQGDARRWIFSSKQSNGKYLSIHLMMNTRIKRHALIRLDANPYLHEWEQYYIDRKRNYAFKAELDKFELMERKSSITQMQ